MISFRQRHQKVIIVHLRWQFMENLHGAVINAESVIEVSASLAHQIRWFLLRNVDILQGIILSWPVHPHSILVWLHNVILCDVGTCQLWQQFASCLGHWSQGDPWPCFVCNFTQTNANQTLKHSSLPNHSTHYNEALQVARCWCLGKLTSLKHFPWFQAPSKPLWIFSVYEPPGLCNTGNDTFQKARVLLATTPQVVKASWRSRVKDGSISGRSLTLKKKTPKTKTTY